VNWYAIVALATLLALAVACGYLVYRRARRAELPPQPAEPSVTVPGAGGWVPDYAWTGVYYPVSYWARYWQLYGLYAAKRGGAIAGSGVILAGTGLRGDTMRHWL
jgi:hypothetical protein